MKCLMLLYVAFPHLRLRSQIIATGRHGRDFAGVALEASSPPREKTRMTYARTGFMSAKQLGIIYYEGATAKKRTRRERSLGEMEKVVPWKALIDLIVPHYSKSSPKGDPMAAASAHVVAQRFAKEATSRNPQRSRSSEIGYFKSLKT